MLCDSSSYIAATLLFRKSKNRLIHDGFQPNDLRSVKNVEVLSLTIASHSNRMTIRWELESVRYPTKVKRKMSAKIDLNQREAIGDADQRPPKAAYQLRFQLRLSCWPKRGLLLSAMRYTPLSGERTINGPLDVATKLAR